MKFFGKLIILMFFLSLIHFTVYAKTNVPPESWEMTFKTDDVLIAAREAALIHYADTFYADTADPDSTRFQICGIHVVDRVEKNNTITLSLCILHENYHVFDGNISSFMPRTHFAKMTFLCNEDSFALTKFQYPEDYTVFYEKDMKDIFGASLYRDILKNKAKYGELAANDAMQIAKRYIAADEEEKKSLSCYKFIESGTNKNAEKIVRNALSHKCPGYIGKYIPTIDYDDEPLLYKLSVEGEQSYSGILTYEVFNLKGKRIHYVKLKVDGDKLNILDGKLPVSNMTNTQKLKENNKITYDLKLAVPDEDLKGFSRNYCQGDNIACVDGDDEYFFVDQDDDWKLIEKHSLKHPHVREKDGKGIEQVIYQNDTFYFLIFDHSVNKSYIIEHPLYKKPKFTTFIEKELYTFAVLPDGYFVAGYDFTHKSTWFAKLKKNGTIEWKCRSKEKNFFPLSCSLIDDQIIVYSATHIEKLSFQITTLSPNGKIINNKIIDMSDKVDQKRRVASVQYFGMTPTDDGYIFTGEIQLGYNMCKGFAVQINTTDDIYSVNVYDEYFRIQRVVYSNGEPFFLGFSENYYSSERECLSYLFTLDGSTKILLPEHALFLHKDNDDNILFSGHKARIYQISGIK